MVFKTDKAIYSVSNMMDGKIVKRAFETFAAAAGAAEALQGIRFLDVEFYAEGPNGTRTSSISGSLYVWGKSGTRRPCNHYLLNAVLERGGK